MGRIQPSGPQAALTRNLGGCLLVFISISEVKGEGVGFCQCPACVLGRPVFEGVGFFFETYSLTVEPFGLPASGPETAGRYQ